ncbi:MAG: T9SS type A sorting domain-containing protein [Bacteroidetes bacterium]|nr:T9SS type A sorting domain-containing protein [Bacteroidota bacterium]
MRKISLHIFLWLCLFSSFTSRAQALWNVGVNVGFEAATPGTYTTANAVSGWTISSQTVTSCNTSTVWQAGSPEFSVMSTPISNLPYIGTLLNSPLGGTNIACLNNTVANSNCTKIAQTFTLSNAPHMAQIAVAGMWEDGGHNCCQQPSFKIQFRDSLGNLFSCPMYSVTGVGCSNTLMTYTLQNGVAWSNWQVFYLDMSIFSGGQVTMEVINQDCTLGDHYSSIFFDANVIGYFGDLQPPWFSYNNYNNTHSIDICPGATTATYSLSPAISQYYSILWTAPPGSPISQAQSTMSVLSLTNAVPSNVYTLTLTSPYPNICPLISYYTIQTNTISPITYTNLTCPNGASGSATVLPNIGGISYNYSWVNSNNTVVSTNSFAPNLAAGVYSVTVSSPNNYLCGFFASTVMIGTAPSLSYTVLRPFCGNEAYLVGNTTNASNFQWYSGTLAIPPNQGGTAPIYTVTSPVNNSALYSVAYDTPQGCRDSIKIFLQAANPSYIMVSSTAPACQGISNGIVTVSITPTLNSPNVLGGYIFAQNSGTSAPVYTYSGSYNPTVTLSNLYAGGVYSINAFNGSCKSNVTFTVDTLAAFDFTLTTPNPINMCAGTSTLVQAITSGSASYTYSWSPINFLSNPIGQLTAVTPFIAGGSSINIVYSVAVSPTINYCPLTKTLSLSVYNPITPTLTPLSELCSNAGQIDISASASPTGGIFYFNGYSNNNGILNTALANFGNNTYTYSNVMETCTVSATGNYTVNEISVNMLGNNPMCIGQSQTLTASGINTLSVNSNTWSTSSNSISVVLSPTSNITYNIEAANLLNGCSISTVIAISVYPLSQYSVSGNTVLCKGQTTTLSINGNYSYVWDNSNISLEISPSADTVCFFYTLDYCSSEADSVIIHVIPVPTVSIAGNTLICRGDATLLNANGANTYTWSNGAQTPNIISFPTTTSQYSVSGTGGNGCIANSSAVIVSVAPLPILDVSGNYTLCSPQILTLTASGAYNYYWQWGVNTHATSTAIIVKPNITTHYTVTGTSQIGCKSTRFVSITIGCVGVDGLKNESLELRVYPNPSKGEIFVEGNFEQGTTILITNVLGQQVVISDLSNTKNSVCLKAKGIYFYKILSNNKQTATGKIIVE